MISRHVGCVFRRNCILDRALRTKKTLSDFSLNHESRKGGNIGDIFYKQSIKDKHISYYLILFTSFQTGQLCLFPLFP